MQHVDDGTIHAWLDGQIDQEHVDLIEEHLRTCAACAARVAVERATFDHAEALLAETTPHVTTPPLPSVRRRTTWPLRAAWAATILIAAGLGWLARDMQSAPPVAEPPQARSASVAPAPVPVVPQAVPAPAPAPERTKAASPAPRHRTAAPEDTAAEKLRTATTSETPAARFRPAPTAVRPPSPISSPLERSVIQPLPPAGAAAPPSTQLLTAASETASARPVAVVDWRPLPRTEAAIRTGMALYGIDGLQPVLTDVSSDRLLARTVYVLESGDLVELIQQRAGTPRSPLFAEGASNANGFGANPRRAAVPADQLQRIASSWTNVVGDVRLTLRSSSSAVDLNALGRRLRID